MPAPAQADPSSRRGAGLGLAAAALFGASAPLAKLLLPESSPLALAALLYLGAALALTFAPRRSAAREPPLRREDLPALAAVVLFGGVLGPVLMLVGLEQVSGVAGALLLNLEAPFTILLAVGVFGEHLDRRALAAALVIILGGGLLGFSPGPTSASAGGVLLLAGACGCWALDNNITQRLSSRDPVALVRVKALAAGGCNLALALLTGARWPHGAQLGPALLLGALSYGLSIVLDVYALRLLGAAREAAYFATAPFFGALLAIPVLGERPTLIQIAAAGVLAAGVIALRRERHDHLHSHPEQEHEHLHVHDAHHQHAHEGPVTEPHAHPHRHAALTHDHPHLPDSHHRHRH